MSLNLGIIASSRSSVPSAALLLDTYTGAAAAYSLRKLRTAYTGAAIRVRRSSDDTETDIGFNVGGGLDTIALTTFCGVGNGFIRTWYDQSGNANNATQTLSSGQPQIIASGVLQTQNSKPSINFDGKALALTTGFSSNSNLSIFFTQRSKLSSNYGSLLGHAAGGGSGPSFSVWNDNRFFISIQINSVSQYAINNGSLIGTNFNILNTIINSSSLNAYVNNTFYSLSTTTWSPSTNTFTQIGRYFNTFGNSNMSELIIYKTDQTSNRTGIVNNTNSYYLIF